MPVAAPAPVDAGFDYEPFRIAGGASA